VPPSPAAPALPSPRDGTPTGGSGGSGLGGTAPAVVLGPPNNGANASVKAQITLSETRRRTVRFGRRIATVATLRDENGRPIAGARVSVLERMNTPGADWVPAREPLVTDRAGRMRWLIPAKFSRTVRYAYKANLANTEFQSTADVVLTVSSRTTIKPSRSFLRNGQTLRFTGRVVSRPVPAGGVLIDLQAKVGRRWQTFKTARTRGNGSWATRYTFRATRGVQTYSFRARVRQDSAFPYAMSSSRVIRVRVAG
jgi:5-hydroxyisourate hydrolase-like protein (transthyretin family)